MSDPLRDQIREDGDLASRLHDAIRSVISDDQLLSGVRLTDKGYKKLASKLGVEVREIELLLRSLVTRLRDDAKRYDTMLEELRSDQKRFSYEKDYLNNVTVRDGVTGGKLFLRGTEANALLNRLKGAQDDQAVLMSYRERMVEDASDEADHMRALGNTGFWGRAGAGCVVLAQDTGRILIAHRSAHVEQPHTWGGWGGAIDSGEDPAKAAVREVKEEAGYRGEIVGIQPLFVFEKNDFRYSNFLVVVPEEFTPVLNWESQGYQWVEFGKWPQPLHFGLQALFGDAASVRTIKSAMGLTETRKPQKRPLGSLDESIVLDEEESFDDEIATAGGSYNFPWSFEGQHGFATARYKGRGPHMQVTVISVRGSEGEVLDVLTHHVREAVHHQAIAFIGDE
jgi:8-oxo-dGTP pyrophosphatase MutT (NUDIX family)